MHETNVKALLDNCDTAFKRYLSSRMVGEDNQVKEELESCELFAGWLSTAHNIPSNDMHSFSVLSCIQRKQ